MVLSDSEIKEELSSGDLEIRRDGEIAVEPASVDLHLGSEYIRPQCSGTVDVTDESTYPEVKCVQGETVVVEPGEFVLGHTEEYIELPSDICGYIWGKSSIGRLGLIIHTAGLCDPGFSGILTLELCNLAPYPIKLHAGQGICQLALHEQSKAISPYSSSDNTYQGQSGVTPSRFYQSENND